MRPFGEVVISPVEVRHTDSELSELARQLKSLNGETRVVMEATGNYHAPVAKLLHDAGLYVSVINAKLVHGYGNNDLRRVKTDRKDAVKLANYGLDRWLTLPRYVPEEDTRLLLKNCYRQYRQYSKVQTVLEEQPDLVAGYGVSKRQPPVFQAQSAGNGSENVGGFLWLNFWHCRCVSEKSQKAFTTNTNVGAESTATTSVKQRRIPFTPRPADTLTSYRNLKRPSCSWNRRLCSSERPLLPLPLSNAKCSP